MRQFFHGTSDKKVDEIEKTGLDNPYLTCELGLAEYYAECQADEDGGEAMVITIQADEKNLRFDYNATEDPVSFGNYRISELEDEVQKMWNEQAELHPEWVKNGYISIPETEFQLSLDTVASCRYEGIIPVKNIIEIN